MLTSAQCIKKWGMPSPNLEKNYMVVWEVPQDIKAALSHVRFPILGGVGFPKKIYLNKAMLVALEQGLRNVIARGFAREMKEWNGVFIVRKKRGGSSLSLHSWGCAFDCNASTNMFGTQPTLSSGFVKCFTDAGFDWGGIWKKADGMHFQLKAI